MISFIIPTSDRTKLLDKLLNSFKDLNTNSIKFEVLIIDNSKDKSALPVYKKNKLKINQLRYFSHPKPGLHEARHRGLKEAKFEILTFLDDDVELKPTFLIGLQESINRGAVLIGGKVIPQFESTPPDWLKELWDQNKIIGSLSLIDLGNKPKKISPYNIFGCNFTIKKQVLIDCGGFHPDSMPKELLLLRGDGETYVSKYVKDQGYIAYYHPNASVKHWVSNERMTFNYFYERSFRQGISNSFTTIRENGVRKPPTNFSLSISNLKAIPYKTRVKLLGNTLQKLSLIQSTGIKNGFNYHQKAVYNDKKLQKWVTKASYLND